MRKKITWNMIYRDFKTRFSEMNKEVMHWCPYDFATIVLWMKDGRRALYNYDNQTVTFVSREDIEARTTQNLHTTL